MLLIKSLFSKSADKKVTQIIRRAKKNNSPQVKRVLLFYDLFVWTFVAAYIIYGGYLIQTDQILIPYILSSLGLVIVVWISTELIFKYFQKLSPKTGVESP